MLCMVMRSLASGCPIRKSTVITGICPSPWLIAACHVLRRLQEPRHPSCALFSFPFIVAFPTLVYRFELTALPWLFSSRLARLLFFDSLDLLVFSVSRSLKRVSILASIMSMSSVWSLKVLSLYGEAFRVWVENNGFEPLTPCLQSRCSSQLS